MRPILWMVLTVVAYSGLLTPAKAQDMPNWGDGLGNILQQNLAFDAAMEQNAANFCTQWYLDRQAYRMRTGDWGYLPGPVSPMDASRSISELNQTYERNNAAWYDNSNRMDHAAGRFADEAIMGYAPYADPYGGGSVSLPYVPDSYTAGPYGVWVPGYSDGGTNLYPVY